MKITRQGNDWINDKNDGFISYRPPGGITYRGKDPDISDLRVRGGTFYCEDAKGFVYSFDGLINGWNKQAPAYMRRIAKRVGRDLELD